MAKISEYRIVIGEGANMNERRAAVFLGKYIKLITGAKLQIVTDCSDAEELEIVVGKTNREQTFAVNFERGREGVWEYEIRTVDGRVYFTGLGTAPDEEPPYDNAYRLTDDGSVGTALAAYRFVEDVLGYQFMYEPYIDYPENSEIEMPADYSVSYTKAALRAEMPKLFDETALYAVPTCDQLHWNMGCIIFKTRSGKLVILDGGHPGDAEHVIEILEKLADGKKPVVSAWLLSHMHSDHFGVYKRLCEELELRARVTVENFYCHLLPNIFFTTLSAEAVPGADKTIDIFRYSDKTLGAAVHTVEVGDIIEVDELSFEVLHVPQMEYAELMNMNDSSVVYKMTHDSGQTMMLLGDAEFVSSNDLVTNARDKLKSDIVQVGHHGCGNVSEECYRLIGADVYIWEIGNKFWYSESGEGLNTHNTGVVRTRNWIMAMGAKIENNYRNTNGILSFELPIKIK